MNPPEIRYEIVYPASVQRVWAALTDPQALARWLLPNDFLPRLGRQFTFQAVVPGDGAQEIQCQVVTLAAPHCLAFTWQDGSRRRPTLVSFTLDAVPTGTRLRLEHSGFDPAVRDAARQRLYRQWQRLPLLLQVQVDATALTDALLAFLQEPRAPARNASPLLAELERSVLGLPLEVLETMVLDGVEQRAFVAEYVTAFLDRPGVVAAGA